MKWKWLQWFPFSRFFQETHLSILPPVTKSTQNNRKQTFSRIHTAKHSITRNYTHWEQRQATTARQAQGLMDSMDMQSALLLRCSMTKGTKRMKDDPNKLQKMIYWQIPRIPPIAWMKDGQRAARLCHGLSRQQNLTVPELYWDSTCKHSDFAEGRNWGHGSVVFTDKR